MGCVCDLDRSARRHIRRHTIYPIYIYIFLSNVSVTILTIAICFDWYRSRIHFKVLVILLYGEHHSLPE